ncbi:MAG: hypothetical protein E6300_04615 [Clostridium sp.]|uniref:hypothetical protein n=1 Tax=Clostridium TaxID=1485 RepID=UPI001EB2389F|nr:MULTISPECIES: hypothetical protein [Clostridium]MBS5884432.1 hypothetical protein [Clostridium sp.]MDU7147750.1 hypothetical protein [Clostridium sp.]MDU7241641.1 hypothetical protein [Clostridium sp.]
MSNNKKKRTDGKIPMKNKSFATPVTSSNISTSFYEYTKKEQVARNTSTNQLY